MSIVSFPFLLFITVFICLYYLVPAGCREYILVAAGLYYAWTFSALSAIILILVTAIAFFAGSFVNHHRKYAKPASAVSIALIVVLMAAARWSSSGGSELSAGPAGMRISLAVVGLSFYGMEAIAYIANVCSGKIEERPNVIQVASYLAFFPTLLSGPIKDPAETVARTARIRGLSRKELWDPQAVREGASLLIWGYFLKLVIADRLAILVDYVYDRYFLFGTVVLATAAVAYALQLYMDFMSCSMIASGIAGMLGYRIPDNFMTPYMALSVTDFWRRWHISLSSWLRNYIYIPLGGNRKGKLRKHINTLVTFAVSGIWHGFGLSFLAWGLLHGLCIITENVVKDHRKAAAGSEAGANISGRREDSASRNPEDDGTDLLRRIGTFLTVTLLWIFFFFFSLKQALSYISRMLLQHDLWVLSDGTLYSLGLNATECNFALFGLFIVFLVSQIQCRRNISFRQWISSQHPVFRVLFCVLLTAGIIVFGKYGPGFDAQGFIYSQF